MISSLLVKYDCLMAHCFTMESVKGNIYDRIGHAITNSPSNELCTSTIHYGDIAFTNYFGGIGLIIENPHVIFSSPEDGATYRLENGVLYFDDDIGTENPDIEIIENSIKQRKKYNEFRVVKYKSAGLFISADEIGWQIATETIKSDLRKFYENTKGYSLPYYYLEKGILKQVEFDEQSNCFIEIFKLIPIEIYKMDINKKAQIMNEHVLTERTIVALQNQNPQFDKYEPLRIYRELILCFKDEDFDGIVQNNIFLNVIYSPASISTVKIGIPFNSKIINFDYNSLIKYPKDERLAIILHEYGHAFNPENKGEEGEYIADDFAINRGSGKALIESLKRNIIKNPVEFDNEITRKRIERIKI